jgi:NDP-sugar pyrophosphorylase family protein
MHHNPVVGRLKAPAENAVLLAKVPFLPVVDDLGIIVDVIMPGTSTSGIQTALVMAGGKGRRLGARTRRRPKPLLQVGNRPLIESVLQRLESARVRQVFVSVHYLADQIEAYLRDRNGSCAIEILREDRPLGTAGCFGQMPESCRDPVLVINADVVTQVDLLALERFHRHHNYDGTIAVARYDVQVPFGVIRHDGDGRFEGIDEKPTLSSFVAAGIYYLAAAFRALVPPSKPMDMPELLTLGHKAGLRIGLFPIHEYWMDVGRPDDLRLARRNSVEGVGEPGSRPNASPAQDTGQHR